DRWVGGVLSGIGAYFGVDPLILRLVYIVLLFLGVGWLIYIILWIVVPPAETAAEKLEMRGEPVTVENLKRVFDEGSERFKSGAERVANEADAFGKRWSGPDGARRQDDLRRGAARGVSKAVGVIGKLLGLFLLGIAVVFTMMLLGGIISGGVITYDNVVGDGTSGYFELGGLIFNTASQAMWFVIGVLFLAVIPIVGLFIAGLRLLFGLRSPRWFAAALSITWFAALVLVFILGARLGNDFRRSEPMRTEAELVQPTGDILYLTNGDRRPDTEHWGLSVDDGELEWDVDGLFTTEDSIHGGWAELDVVRSPDSLFHVMVVRRSQGRSSKAALIRASNIRYTMHQQDSLLTFSPWVSFPKEDKFRAQRVRFVVQVPVGKAVHFSGTMGFLLDDVDNITNTYDGHMVGRTWTMTEQGLSSDARPGDLTVPADTTTSTIEIRANGKKRKLTVTATNGPVATVQAATVWRGIPKRKADAPEPVAFVMPDLFNILFQHI
ncbi:MAG: PspC domain-containing protein, partial [Flavobacteriales bacterium]|nr:PspC domain-containing protein [Flavobacteriales bacterium]